MSIKPTYIDLFCGAGGLSLGFDEAGFQNVFSIEYNPVFAETYKKNFPKHNLIVDDIRNLSLEKIKTLIGNNQIDVVIGGSPCQGFSKAGNIGRQFLEDERNYLFKEFVRVVDVVKPKYLLFENVSALYTHNKGKTINEIINEFERIGYPFSSFALLLLCVFALTPLRSPSHFLIFSFSFLLFCSFALCRACVKSLSLKRSFAHIHTSAKARLYLLSFL